MLCVSEVSPAVDEAVTFTVDAVDPDARLFPLSGCAPNEIRFGDERSGCGASPGCALPGPDVPLPVPERGTIHDELVHAYESPGTYTAAVQLRSGSQCPHPYADDALVELEMVVR